MVQGFSLSRYLTLQMWENLGKLFAGFFHCCLHTSSLLPSPGFFHLVPADFSGVSDNHFMSGCMFRRCSGSACLPKQGHLAAVVEKGTHTFLLCTSPPASHGDHSHRRLQGSTLIELEFGQRFSSLCSSLSAHSISSVQDVLLPCSLCPGGPLLFLYTATPMFLVGCGGSRTCLFLGTVTVSPWVDSLGLSCCTVEVPR